MTILLESELFDENIFFEDIDLLLKFCSKNRYEFIIGDPYVDVSNYAKNSRRIQVELLKEIIVKSANLKSHNLTLGVDNNIDLNTYSLKDGIIYLENPALIFMENANNDQKFIRGILQKFKIGQKAFECYKKRWLEFRHCGGKNDIINQVNQELRKFRNETLNNSYYLRGIVICDSDKKLPNQTVNLDNLIKHCDENRITLHILEKREIENYLPLSMLENLENLDIEKVNALKTLSPAQQDFYDIEKGFNINSKNKLDDFFKPISNEVYNHLSRGFSHKDFNTKTEIPSLFLSDKLSQEMLQEKCMHQTNPKELENIIQHINDLL